VALLFLAAYAIGLVVFIRRFVRRERFGDNRLEDVVAELAAGVWPLVLVVWLMRSRLPRGVHDRLAQYLRP
jgi:hypothetical protein